MATRQSTIYLAGGFLVTAGCLIAVKITFNGPDPYQPELGSLTGQRILITGGNTGVGLESAKRLAAGGATVILTSRNVDKGSEALQKVKEYASSLGVDTNDKVHMVQLDLADWNNVREFPKRLEACRGMSASSPSEAGGDAVHIDVLLNNAGVGNLPTRTTTIDGYEQTFQVNHLSPFLLTSLLFPTHLNPKGARIINVSSLGHIFMWKGLDFGNLNSEKSFDPWLTYCASKLANIYFTQELQRRATAADRNVTVVSLTPGVTRTDYFRNMMGEERFEQMKAKPTWRDYFIIVPFWFLSHSVDRGAATQVWIAAGGGGGREQAGGKFFEDCKERKLLAIAQDEGQAKKLWEVSEKMTGKKFDV